MLLEQITPLVLTFNEAANIGRTLAALSWAPRVVVLDSGSTDGTQKIACGFANVSLVANEFVGFANQLNFGLTGCGIASDWVMRLDADFLLTAELLESLRQIVPEEDVAAYRFAVRYCVGGVPLRRSLYPRIPALVRRSAVRFVQDGHGDKLVAGGRIVDVAGAIWHDDRKDFSRWLVSQLGYMRQEAEKLATTPWADLSWADRLRRTRFLGPPAAVLYCLFVQGLLFDGWRGLRYTAERTIAELLLSICLIERDPGATDRRPLDSRSA